MINEKAMLLAGEIVSRALEAVTVQGPCAVDPFRKGRRPHRRFVASRRGDAAVVAI
jgi:hypothetical protein